MYYVLPIYINLICDFKKISKKTIISIMGSDFYRAHAKDRIKARKIYDSVDAITFNNPQHQKS